MARARARARASASRGTLRGLVQEGNERRMCCCRCCEWAERGNTANQVTLLQEGLVEKLRKTGWGMAGSYREHVSRIRQPG